MKAVDRVYLKPHANETGIAICAVCDESEFSRVSEWIEYNCLLGGERFYIYVNKGFAETLRALVSEDYLDKVTVLDFQDSTDEVCDEFLYWHCLVNYSCLHDWIGFFQVNEFLVPLKNRSLSELLKNFSHVGGLAVFKYQFGSNYCIHKQGNAVRAFTRRSREDFYANASFAVLINTKYVLHEVPEEEKRFKFQPGFFCVDEVGKAFFDNRPARTSKVVQMNVYSIRSREEWMVSKAATMCDSDLEKLRLFESLDRQCNLVEDRSAVDILDSNLKRLSFYDVKNGNTFNSFFINQVRRVGRRSTIMVANAIFGEADVYDELECSERNLRSGTGGTRIGSCRFVTSESPFILFSSQFKCLPWTALLLREPISRIWSEIASMDAEKPEEILECFPEISNRQLNLLGGDFGIAMERLKAYDFVGWVEELDIFFEELGNVIGHPIPCVHAGKSNKGAPPLNIRKRIEALAEAEISVIDAIRRRSTTSFFKNQLCAGKHLR